MTRKQRRATIIVAGMTGVSAAVGLFAYGLRNKITFFLSPAEATQNTVAPGLRFRLGGLVAAGSLHREGDGTAVFTVTDGAASIAVTYKGILPDLLREGQGVVAEGELSRPGLFAADTVLAKHDENYMPPEVAAALKKNGRWKGQQQAGSAAQPGS